MDMRPAKHRFSMGKFISSVLNWNPLEKLLGKFKKQNPGEREEGPSCHSHASHTPTNGYFDGILSKPPPPPWLLTQHALSQTSQF